MSDKIGKIRKGKTAVVKKLEQKPRDEVLWKVVARLNGIDLSKDSKKK